MPASDFHNPYAFVPAPASPEGAPPTVPGTAPRHGGLSPHITHDRFCSTVGEEDCFSGRLFCTLTVEELMLVGGRQTKGDKDRRQPRSVAPFQLPDGKWALPATSLKGMISSVLEASTGSTLRVLTNRAPSQAKRDARNAADMKKSDPRQYSLSDNGTRVNLGYPHAYFRALSPHLVPLEAGDARTFLTFAELLFGFVEGAQAGAKADSHSAALAGRVRFSFARLAGDTKTERGRTQILDSPKPPSPSLYFRPKNKPQGAHIPRTSVTPAQHVPQGRKFYLHRQQLQRSDWETRNPSDQAHQKADITAIAAGAVFHFTVDFTNLSRMELEALCWSLSPSDAFCHKLGMGKPLGLGKVRLQPVALLRMVPAQRYSIEGFQSGTRWQTGWTAPGFAIQNWETLPDPAAPAPWQGLADGALAPVAFREAFERRIAADWKDLVPVLGAIRTFGEPQQVRAPVHYPQPTHRTKTKRQEPVPVEGAQMETNSYEWFVNNDRDAQPQHLAAPVGGRLPQLRRNSERSGARGNHDPRRPDHRGGRRDHPPRTEDYPPPPPAPKIIREPKDLTGGDHWFIVTVCKGQKLKFRPEKIGDFETFTEGSLDPVGRAKLLAEGISEGDRRLLHVLGCGGGGFQLALPTES